MTVVYIPVPSTYLHIQKFIVKDHNRQKSVRKHLGVHLGRVPVHKHVPDTTTLMQTRLYARIKPSLSKILCVNCARGFLGRWQGPATPMSPLRVTRKRWKHLEPSHLSPLFRGQSRNKIYIFVETTRIRKHRFPKKRSLYLRNILKRFLDEFYYYPLLYSFSFSPLWRFANFIFNGKS